MNIASSSRPANRRSRHVSVALLALVAVLLSTFVGGTASAATYEFKDVRSGHKFRTEITWLADQQITTGYADGSFKPRDSVSREAFAAFLYRLAGKPSVNLPSRSPFKDVSTSAQFFKEIVWLSQQGITTGWADGTFRPRDKISREAIAAFLYRYEGRPSSTVPAKSPFKDMKPSSKFYREVTWLSRTGMTTGYSDGTFRPKANVSREAVAAFLYRGNTVKRGNGTVAVGNGIRPGIYSAVAAGDSFYEACYWERRSTTGTSFAGIITNEFTSHRTIVEILPSDRYFHADGCSGWTPLRKVSPSATSVGDGTHAVGYHMRPGRYAAKGGEGCYWEVVTDFTGNFSALVENEYIDGRPAEVRVYEGEGFMSDRCGTWARVGN